MNLLNLNQVTLFCYETREPLLAEWAIKKCLLKANFKEIILLTDFELVKNQIPEIKYVQAPKDSSVENYSKWMIEKLGEFVSGTHVLVIQWDSFIVNAKLWNDKFFFYDYIGAVWPHHANNSVGNGGFSLRSKKLLNALNDPDIIIGHPEDYYICVNNKKLLEEKYNIKFAPKEIADLFSVERSKWHPAFGFHGFFNFAHVLNEKELEDFLNIIPKSMLNNVDTYDLLDSSENKNLNGVVKLIRRKLSFKWKYRYSYLQNKLKLLYQN
jgi:hypothetical protein